MIRVVLDMQCAEECGYIGNSRDEFADGKGGYECPKCGSSHVYWIGRVDKEDLDGKDM